MPSWAIAAESWAAAATPNISNHIFIEALLFWVYIFISVEWIEIQRWYVYIKFYFGTKMQAKIDLTVQTM